MSIPSIVIVRSSFSEFGGVEKVTLDVIRNLLQHQIQVQLLTWPGQEWPISHPKLHIITVGVQKGPRLLQAFSFNLAVEAYLRKTKPNHIFSFDRVITFTHMHGGGGTHRTFLNIKNANSGFFSRNLRRASLFHRYTLHVEKKGFFNPRLKKVQCASSLVKKDIINDYGLPETKLDVIPNGIDWHTIGQVFVQRQKTITDLSHHCDLDPSRSYLLFLGSGFERKGLDIAIRGMPHMPEHFDLLVVGKGRTAFYRNLAQKLSIDHRIHFLGPQNEGWKYCALCKALVLPSRYEPFGIAAAEANAMGIPVLISDQTGYKDWVAEGKNGVILELPATQETLKDAFSRLLVTIESPRLTAEEIRQNTLQLDHEILMHQLLHDFLEVEG